MLIISNLDSSWLGYQFRCVVDGKPGIREYLQFVNFFTGAVNNDWENPLNWSCNSVPDVNTDVVIQSANVAIHTNVSCRSLSLKAGASATTKKGSILTITN